jgi:hypothetical protein
MCSGTRYVYRLATGNVTATSANSVIPSRTLRDRSDLGSTCDHSRQPGRKLADEIIRKLFRRFIPIIGSAIFVISRIAFGPLLSNPPSC